MKTLKCLTILSMLGAMQPGRLVHGQDQVVVRFELYRARGDISGKTSLTDNIWSGLSEKLEAKKGPFTFFTLADLKVACVQLKAGEEGWTWNGRDQLPPGSGVEKVAAPLVTQLVGRRFEVSVTTPIEYFEARDDGLFEHRTANESAGVSISTHLEAGVEGRVVLRNLTLETKTVADREELEGVSLPVGKPIFSSERMETTISVEPDRDYGIQVLTRSEGVLFLRVRVERMGEGSR